MKQRNTRKAVVYESITGRDRFSLYRNIMFGRAVYIIEPFVGYHYHLTFPNRLPDFVQRLIERKKITLIPASHYNPGDLYLRITNRAVDCLEAVYPYYRRRYGKIIDLLIRLVGSPEAERAFRKHLVDKLSLYFSQNEIIKKTKEFVRSDTVTIAAYMNTCMYSHIEELVKQSGQEYFDTATVRFSLGARDRSFRENSMRSGINLVSFILQILSGLGKKKRNTTDECRSYRFGINVFSGRQLRGKQLHAGFLLNGNTITRRDIVFFMSGALGDKDREKLSKYGCDIEVISKSRVSSSRPLGWARLLSAVLVCPFFKGHETVSVARTFYHTYLLYRHLLTHVGITDFITHSDFDPIHVARNIALKEEGVETWYFTDSVNLPYQYFDYREKGFVRHPFWMDLFYDHFVTWNEITARYFQSHSNPMKEAHVVGSLRSDDIVPKEIARERHKGFLSIMKPDSFVIAAFDTTYSLNGYACYEEGLAFAEHLLRLVQESADIYIILKEKKDRLIHDRLDYINGRRLISLYNRMNEHERITVFLRDIDASDLIALSDLVISFPFTSVTMEAISANRFGIWHDPMGIYTNSVYHDTPYLVTHSYDELKGVIDTVRDKENLIPPNQLFTDSMLIDPYRDGRAIERFRELLLHHE